MDRRTIAVEWAGRRVDAADPAPIAGRLFELDAPTVRRTERAAAAVRTVGERATGVFEVAARLLLRAEGLASSAIEGLQASAADVAVAEAAGDAERHGTAAWVADNLAVVTEALTEPGPLDRARVFAWHARLMRHATTIDAEHVGAWRDRLGWVGGPNPMLATHVAVPAENIESLMQDLFAFCARDDVDPVTQAAIAHAQFETIHPFADGNGRIGRVLIGFILTRRLDVRFSPPVSLEFARDIGGYQAGLTLFRQDAVENWISWFAAAVDRAAARTVAVLDAVATLERSWEAAVAHLRADAAARRMLPHLPAYPVLNAATVARVLGVSEEAGRVALAALRDAGIVHEVETAPHRSGRPARWWAATDLLALIGR